MGMVTKLSILSAAPLFVAASSAAAMPGGPPIAYAFNSGKAIDVYLSDVAQTAKVKVYSTTSQHSLWQIDMRPGGNQLALVENVSPPSIFGTIKIISYSDAGVVSNITSVGPDNVCQVQGIDYHPTDGSILVSRGCNKGTILEVRRLVNGVYDSSPIITLDNPGGNMAAGYVRWLGDGSGFLWAFGDVANGGRIERHMLSNPYAPVTVYKTGDFSLPNWLDVARCASNLDSSCSKILVTTRAGQLHLVTFDSFGGTDQGALYGANSTDGHYSPDNAHILWRYQTHSGYQLMIDNAVWLSKGPTGVKDWRQ